MHRCEADRRGRDQRVEGKSGGEGGLELVHDLLMMVRPHELHSFLEEVGGRCTKTMYHPSFIHAQL